MAPRTSRPVLVAAVAASALTLFLGLYFAFAATIYIALHQVGVPESVLESAFAPAILLSEHAETYGAWCDWQFKKLEPVFRP